MLHAILSVTIVYITSVQLKVIESQLLRNQQMVILGSIICKQLIDRDFLKNVHAQNLQYPAQTFVDSMNLIETGDHQVNADCNPDLGANCVLSGAEKGFDTEVLFDPFEEEFDLPPAFINGCNGYGGQFEVVCEEDQPLAALGIDIADTPERLGVIALSLPCAQADDLVASQPGGFIDGPGLLDAELGVAFCTYNKGCPCLLNTIETCEIEIASVDNVDAAGFDDDLVEKMNVVDGTIGNTDEYWDGAGQIDLGMQFNRGLGFTEVRPREHGKAQVDCRGINGIDHLFKIEPVGVMGIEFTGFANENMSESFIDTPIAELVRISQIGSGNVATDTHRVPLRTVAQASFNIPQTLAEGDLGESHREELVAGRHPSAGSGHRVALDATRQLLWIQHIADLCKYETSSVHPLLRMKLTKTCQPVQMQDTPFEPLAA